MAVSVACLVPLEVVEGLSTARRQWAMITVSWIVTIVDMAPEVGRPVKPGTRTNKDSTHKPVRAIVAIRGAIIWRIVKVAVGANRRRADVDANRYLSRRSSRSHQHAAQKDNGKC